MARAATYNANPRRLNFSGCLLPPSIYHKRPQRLGSGGTAKEEDPRRRARTIACAPRDESPSGADRKENNFCDAGRSVSVLNSCTPCTAFLTFCLTAGVSDRYTFQEIRTTEMHRRCDTLNYAWWQYRLARQARAFCMVARQQLDHQEHMTELSAQAM